jgi:two-component sensor histidine kinase
MDKSFWNQRPLLLLLEIPGNSQKRFEMQKEERRLAKELRVRFKNSYQVIHQMLGQI